jgi:prophage regulatory protein
MVPHQSPQSPTFLRRRDVEKRVGLRRSAIYDAVKLGTFPAPVRLGARSVGWLEHEISAWIEARVAASRAGS